MKVKGLPDGMVALAYDAKLKRPGCVLIQAAMGGDAALVRRFDSSSWLVDITPDMKLYALTPLQAEQLVMLSEPL